MRSSPLFVASVVNYALSHSVLVKHDQTIIGITDTLFCKQ